MKTENDKKESAAIISSLEKDISLLKNENKELSDKIEHLNEQIQENEPATIYGNNKGQIIDANRKALQLTGYDIDEICAKNIKELFVQIENTRIKDSDEDNEISKEQILVKKNGKKIFVSVKVHFTSKGTYKIRLKNINKQKSTEIALIEAQSRYQELAENINDVIWTANNTLKISYISSSIKKITGFSPDVYYHRPLNELLTPISYQLLIDTIQKEGDLLKLHTQTKKNYNITIEIKLYQKYHSSVWAELSASLILDHFGEIIGYKGIIRNIDAQKRTQEILDKRNYKYNFALKSVGSGVWELTADLTRINIDENLLHILGYNKNEKKPYLNDWINLTHKEDRIYIIDILQDMLDGNRNSAHYECRRVHKNEKILWFSDYVETIADEDGEIIGLLGTSKNITNEKLTEEKKFRYYAGLQMLIENTFQFLKFDNPEAIYNYTGKILAQNIPDSLIIINDVDEKNNKIKPVRYVGTLNQKLIKQLDNKLKSGNGIEKELNHEIFKLLLQKFLIECEPESPIINTLLNPAEKDLISSVLEGFRIYVIGSGSNKNVENSIIIITKDKTELNNKEFIEAFITLFSIILGKNRIESELEKSNETKDKFFSIISHDLKNPFNTLIGFSGLIIQNIEKISKEKVLEFARLIHDAALQSHEMMQNLFEWVNSQKGVMECRPAKVNLNEIILANIKLFSSEAVKKKIHLNFHEGPEIELYADIDMLNTIIRNLISNALKFTHEGGNVNVQYELMDEDVFVSVIDNGIGIPEDKQKNIFKLVSNKSTIGTGMEKGTGLGLLLCEEFVHMNGGKIWVESKEGNGSAFRFTIPLKKKVQLQ